ncbi:hypothetical protein XENORESO_019198 [Xenotaenia resolanae]|uniref:Uncharacterized protein n=1 Tax=Xenotaenia resolanae TaxID=208358 RepID=A0ABV0W490_9TELE
MPQTQWPARIVLTYYWRNFSGRWRDEVSQLASGSKQVTTNDFRRLSGTSHCPPGAASQRPHIDLNTENDGGAEEVTGMKDGMNTAEKWRGTAGTLVGCEKKQ